MANEWFRRTAWTKNDQAEFEARLARARKQNRAQYLRIQASHLMEAANPKLTSAALELLNRMLAEYPSDIQVAQAHVQRAECHIRYHPTLGLVRDTGSDIHSRHEALTGSARP